MKREANRLALGVIVCILSAIGLMFVFAPWAAVIVFVLLVAVLAINAGRKDGVKRGVVEFLKDMLFNW